MKKLMKRKYIITGILIGCLLLIAVLDLLVREF